MSQRSHIAQSGSSAISECSAACSDAEQLRHLLEPVELLGSGRTRPPRSRTSSRAGRAGRLEHVAVADRPPLVGDDLLGDRDAAEVQVEAEPPLDAQRLLDRGLRLLLRLRVPVDRGRLDDRRARDVVELAHEVLLAEVEVDRALVHGRVRAVRSTRPSTEPVEPSTTVNESGSPERSGRARPGSRGPPRRSRRRPLELGQPAARAERLVAERLRVGVVERRLERGREDVRVEHARVRVVEDRRLDAAPEQRLRLAHEELVERVLARDQHREPVAAAAGAAPLLAQRATVPGKPTEIAQSSRPMSMPSSSASVAETPSSSPSTSRRSISRRCAGV